jgi:hypothetical protein
MTIEYEFEKFIFASVILTVFIIISLAISLGLTMLEHYKYGKTQDLLRNTPK